MDEDDYGYNEGSDRDNWEDEQVFQDREGEEAEDLGREFDEDEAESLFRDSYEALFGVRPAFSVEYLSITQIRARTANLQAAHASRQFVFA